MIEQRIHMPQIQAPSGVACARAAIRPRTAPFSVANGFCTSVPTTQVAGATLIPNRRPRIE